MAGLAFVSIVSGTILLAGAHVIADEPPPAQPVVVEEAPEAADPAPQEESLKKPAVVPKPLSPSVIKGLDWLVAHQHPTGGWGQGEESPRMGGRLPAKGGQDLRDLPNVADTAMAALALIRSGSTPSAGAYSTSILRAVEFVCSEIEEADDESLWITNVRGTRVQGKIGPYIDTFLAALLLAEVKDHMPNDEGETRVAAALEKTTAKIQRHQQSDGTWAGRAWAGGLSNAMAVKALNRASQVGIAVDEEVRARAERSAQFRAQTGAGGRFADDGRSAGIELYAAASAVGELNDAVQANSPTRGVVLGRRDFARGRITALEEQLANTQGDEQIKELKAEMAKHKAALEGADELIQRFDEAERDLQTARSAIAARLTDDRFVAGFGTNGGEEFISYLNIGETLVLEGGQAWQEFDQRMTANLTRVQNDDGSWTGHHCITGRTFCTASALMVLTVDRSPNAIAQTLSRK